MAGAKPVLLDWACGGTALVGLLLQAGLERRRRRKGRARSDEGLRAEKGTWVRRLWPWASDSDKKGRRAA